MRLKGTLPFLITEHYRRTQSCVMRWFHGTNDEYTSIFFVLSREGCLLVRAKWSDLDIFLYYYTKNNF